MNKDQFRELAKKLGLKTGAELEKIIEFENADLTSLNKGEEDRSDDFALENSAELQDEKIGVKGKGDYSVVGEKMEEVPLPNDKPATFNNVGENTSAIDDSYYTLPQNYTNKYNLTRGDFGPIEIDKALFASINDLGMVDIEYISCLSLLSLKDVVLSLDGKIFKDPEKQGSYFYQGYTLAEEYLSGNVVKKYRLAVEAEAKNRGVYAKNVAALRAKLPKKPNFSEISFNLGSPVIPPSYVAEFVQYLYRVSLVKNKRICEVVYVKPLHRWVVILNIDVRSTVLASKTYGTERMDMFKILEKILNHEQIRITDVDESGKSRRLNREQTMLAEDKRTRLKEGFVRWLNELSPDKKQELTDIYYQSFCGFVPREFKAERLLNLKKSINGISLYKYQKNAVARIVSSQSTLLAHDVGAGKTYAMIVAAHELKRRNPSSKCMIAVPNSILAQWTEDYKMLYPEAQILTVTPLDFSPENRPLTLLKMSQNCEAILISHSTFEMIECGKSVAIAQLKERLAVIDSNIDENLKRRLQVKNKINGLLTKERERINFKISELEAKSYEWLTFEELNVTSLFIDEAHNYKNLPLESSLGQVKGINLEGSKKCADIYQKTQSVIAKPNSHIVFATGTPVTNSVADVYVMQKYLAGDMLEQCDIAYFDNWAGTFGEITRAYEIDVDTEGYRLTSRFNRFNNLTQLSTMLNCFTDFHVAGKDGLPEVERIQTVVVKKTKLQIALLGEISERVERIRAGEVDRKEDNLLKVTTDGRKLALDARLVDEEALEQSGNKIGACALEVAKLFFKHPGTTQLVFSDIGTPKTKYNVYDDLKQRLVAYGISEESIGFVHDATSDLKRARLFESVNNGVIRVLIGSTFKLGTGVNVQERLIAIHHLDVPWRPSDMVQREGRLVRRGNTNEKVFIYRYVTDGSFDAYSWQLLENKQRFITDLLTGTASGADERRLDDAVLSYAEVKALAVGNPLVKTRVETVNEIARLKTLLKEEQKKQEEIDYLKRVLPEKISEEKNKLYAIKGDAAHAENLPEIADKEAIGQLISKAISENAMGNKEIYITEINGFSLYLPANFNKVRPYLILQRQMRYTVDIVTFAVGAVIKIENYIKSIKLTIAKRAEELEQLQIQLSQANSAVFCSESLKAQIEQLEQQLKNIDSQLGL
ncbi:MAG: DEAD/DEAH box helicase family protein [Clostridia bacterium]|nr:DEAD/DEAH box helicase family protein [Clostridia bacterium]